MIIVKAKYADIPQIVTLVESQKKYLKSKGIPQWQGIYPNEDTFKQDIDLSRLYILKDEEKIIGLFALVYPDHDYDYVEDGKWSSDTPYVAIHRLCVDDEYKGKGCASLMFSYLKENYNHLRVDTHALNEAMNKCLIKNGFKYIGIVYMEDKTLRNAYEWLKV